MTCKFFVSAMPWKGVKTHKPLFRVRFLKCCAMLLREGEADVELYRLTAVELSAMLKSREVSAEEIAKSCARRMDATEPMVDAFLHTDSENMQRQAQTVDKMLAAGEPLGMLAGIPVGLKDNICTKGTVTSCASRMLEHYLPFYDATVVEKLREAGALLAGKQNMDEFAMGLSCENSYFKVTKNPWNLAHVPGGSSGGSAAAVAACQVPLSLGSDTGGSVRCPASYCGVVGVKPTYGAVSRFGLVAFASSLDQIGPLARTVDDAALLFAAICGEDAARDATSRPYVFPGIAKDTSVNELVVGLPAEYFGPDIHPTVKHAVMQAVRVLENLGAQVQEISLPFAGYALPVYHIISAAEASSNLARYDGVRYGFSAGHADTLDDLYEITRGEGFGAEVKRRILLGTYVLSGKQYDVFYKRAKGLQRLIIQTFIQAFEKCNVIITPTCPTTALEIGENENDLQESYTADACTVPASLAGLPAISVPCGLDEMGLPVGMQIIGPAFSEHRIFEVAKCYETAVGGFAVKEALP